ncbi:flagellar biosynthesis/type III secretory pathway protein [Desulfobacter hydrogenophilus]|uniref:Flagellar assembly protein FliH n=1 Tax=Desulfobacter hydrogenophilus TaxID=2291 RepID=A0A328FH66_9BACT|nr:FliH/SctL family protein [Desulfobacter hydrogenophilus]NDY73397.1 flagellar biosynthesis/type III secretory pathway protein [Desulfobacter hydrogenophilus]QBH15552.1 flagellar biosynthesis/type III secretory pathway protein [Desulfobacter hydrogenophilus]RAM03931.1 flagellar biosynthesis/type III secretory pathway protein [Desulfobacter hydrogenophilus]
MSLSDQDEHKDESFPSQDDEFKAIDVGSLDNFDKEVSRSDAQPDFDRFKLLFDPLEVEREEGGFEALYKITKQLKKELFEPLIQGADVDADKPDLKKDVSGLLEEAQGSDEPEDRPTPEEQGFAAGYEQGMAQGLEKGQVAGHAKGYEEGLEKGRKEGFKQGETDGFAKGEAEGYEKGIEDGRDDGKQEIVQEMAQILEPFQQALETADQMLENMLARYETQLVELVCQIAGKVVLAKLDSDDAVIKNTILDALSQLASPEEITLSVADEDYEYVEMIKETFFESIRSLTHITVNTDAMIPKGGCRIESAGATITTDPESKLKAVYDAIAKAGI